MLNQENSTDSNETIPNLNNLGSMKDVLLTYYYPQGKLNNNNLLVLHTGESKGGDINTAEQILQSSNELQLTDDEIDKFNVIANGTLVDRTISIGKGLVGKLLPSNKTH